MGKTIIDLLDSSKKIHPTDILNRVESLETQIQVLYDHCLENGQDSVATNLLGGLVDSSTILHHLVLTVVEKIELGYRYRLQFQPFF